MLQHGDIIGTLQAREQLDAPLVLSERSSRPNVRFAVTLH